MAVLKCCIRATKIIFKHLHKPTCFMESIRCILNCVSVIQKDLQKDHKNFIMAILECRLRATKIIFKPLNPLVLWKV